MLDGTHSLKHTRSIATFPLQMGPKLEDSGSSSGTFGERLKSPPLSEPPSGTLGELSAQARDPFRNAPVEASRLQSPLHHSQSIPGLGMGGMGRGPAVGQSEHTLTPRRSQLVMGSATRLPSLRSSGLNLSPTQPLRRSSSGQYEPLPTSLDVNHLDSLPPLQPPSSQNGYARPEWMRYPLHSSLRDAGQLAGQTSLRSRASVSGMDLSSIDLPPLSTPLPGGQPPSSISPGAHRRSSVMSMRQASRSPNDPYPRSGSLLRSRSSTSGLEASSSSSSLEPERWESNAAPSFAFVKREPLDTSLPAPSGMPGLPGLSTPHIPPGPGVSGMYSAHIPQAPSESYRLGQLQPPGPDMAGLPPLNSFAPMHAMPPLAPLGEYPGHPPRTMTPSMYGPPGSAGLGPLPVMGYPGMPPYGHYPLPPGQPVYPYPPPPGELVYSYYPPVPHFLPAQMAPLYGRPRLHVCYVCNRDFNRQPDLERHMRIHTGETPYVCRTCGKDFQRKDALLRHERTHSKKDAEGQADGQALADQPLIDPGPEPHFRCRSCGRSFQRKDAMLRHERTHMV